MPCVSSILGSGHRLRTLTDHLGDAMFQIRGSSVLTTSRRPPSAGVHYHMYVLVGQKQILAGLDLLSYADVNSFSFDRAYHMHGQPWPFVPQSNVSQVAQCQCQRPTPPRTGQTAHKRKGRFHALLICTYRTCPEQTGARGMQGERLDMPEQKGNQASRLEPNSSVLGWVLADRPNSSLVHSFPQTSPILVT
ncbi:hypothetical protein H4582DRAFT_267034 [Lactarius indigo]|nr:hypothetical protein H4582DRAFT_267034 [Lactarius indigo]